MTNRPSEPGHIGEAKDAEADEHDVLTRHSEEVVETRCLEGVAELRIDPFVGTEYDADDKRPALARGPECESVTDCRAQPVAHASDPAPPADDVPGTARMENDMDPPPCEPAPLVEAGLGPSRGDRARPELEHRTLRRCTPYGQLQ